MGGPPNIYIDKLFPCLIEWQEYLNSKRKCVKSSVSLTYAYENAKIYIFWNAKKKNTRPDNKFLLQTVGAIGKLRRSKKKLSWKNVQVKLMSFYFINFETIGK